jgi:hypothetical protein
MSDSHISPQEYELSLKALINRIKTYLESGEGDTDQIIREAQELLEMKDVYPEALRRHRELEGLLGELLARREQERFRGSSKDEREAPGCMLGWLFGDRG